MATAIPTFNMVEPSAAPPKTLKTMSEEDRKVREAYTALVKAVVPGKVMKVQIPEGETARSLGIRVGHAVVDAGMKDKFDTWNDGTFYYVSVKEPVKSNGSAAPKSE